ncbi:hypothetical protein V6N13_134819 [Hibiscus sabdariffa]
MDSAEEIFDSSLNLEETHYQEGYKEGYNHGVTTGMEEGREVGLKTGFETGEELGFYKGCVDVWNSVIQVDPTRFSTRVQKNIKQMQELIQEYPVMDPENESVQEKMEALRIKFRVIRVALASLVLDLKQVERGGEAKMLNKMLARGKSWYTVVSRLSPKPSQDSCPSKDTVFAVVKSALETIDFELHSGTHPRLGVVDHICFHPLAHTSLDQAALVAKSLAADIGSKLEVPTFLYGAADEKGRLLDSIRRELGYFKPSSGSILWSGGSKSESLPLKPDAGPAQASPTKGLRNK